MERMLADCNVVTLQRQFVVVSRCKQTIGVVCALPTIIWCWDPCARNRDGDVCTGVTTAHFTLQHAGGFAQLLRLEVAPTDHRITQVPFGRIERQSCLAGVHFMKFIPQL